MFPYVHKKRLLIHAGAGRGTFIITRLTIKILEVVFVGDGAVKWQQANKW